jgi:hypothetical protein
VTTTSDWIQIREEGGGSRPAVLAHELVHAWLGKEWDTLPIVVEEALCEVVAEAADPAERPTRRLRAVLYFETAFKGGFRFDAQGYPIEPRRLSVAGSPSIFLVETFHGTAKMKIDRAGIPSVVEMLELDGKELLTYRDLGQQNLMREVGYVIVSRIPIDGLLDLCLRAREEGLARVPRRPAARGGGHREPEARRVGADVPRRVRGRGEGGAPAAGRADDSRERAGDRVARFHRVERAGPLTMDERSRRPHPGLERIPPARWPTREEARASRLFSPIRLGPVTARARTWVPAMVPWRSVEEGFVTKDLLDWYGRFADGRPGVLVVEATGVRDVPSGPLLRIGHDRFVPGLRSSSRSSASDRRARRSSSCRSSTSSR